MLSDWYGGRREEGDIDRRGILDKYFKGRSYGLESLIEIVSEHALLSYYLPV